MRSVFICILIATIVQGCARFGRNISVGVFDGDTGEPVIGAEVVVNYGRMVYLKCLDFFPPRDNSAKTGGDGIARVNISGESKFWDALAAAGTDTTVSISAPGYLPHSFTDADFQGEPFGRREVKGQTIYAVPIYRLPAPQIVVVVPDGYRGPVRITRRFSDKWIQDEPGKRVFEFHASDQGDVEMEASPLIYRTVINWGYIQARDVSPGEIRFRYASGQEIPRILASAFSIRRFHAIVATQPALRFPPQVRDRPNIRALIERERERQKTAASRPAPAPPQFGVDFIASDGVAQSGPPQTRSLYVVGGEEEMLRVYETYQPQPYGSTWSANINMSQQFEKAWKLR